MDDSPSKRIAGLDMLRATAILLVVFRHSHHLITPVYFPLPDGVDLFFVLSGYLIGTILFEAIQSQGTFTRSTLYSFLKRRWFRTLPNYFLFLLINLLIVYWSQAEVADTKLLWRYFAFLQNFDYPRMFFYWESWSLTVEEWFYLFFSGFLFLLLYLKVATVKDKILLTIAGFLILPLIYRILHSLSVDSLHWDVYYRKLVVTRLDTIGFGLLGAYLHLYQPLFWQKIRNSSFITGCLLFILLSSFSFSSHDFFHKTLYFSISAFSILMLLPKLTTIRQLGSQTKLFEFISRVSYSAYLVHMPLLLLFPNHTQLSLLLRMLNYAGYLSLVFFLSWMIYTFFEKPILEKAAGHSATP